MILKRILLIVSCFVLLFSFAVVVSADSPSTGTEFDDLSYFDISSNLGDLRLYLPKGVSSDAFQVKNGKLYNLTDTTVYLYCPSFSDYIFSASRFGSVMYRASNYNSVELTGISLIDTVSVPSWELPELILTGFVLIAIVILLWRCFR